MTDDSLRFLRALTWDEVFSLWRDGEAGLPRWVEHYTKGGFSSWDAWRKNTLKDVHYEDLSWSLVEVKGPSETVSHFLGGPFRAWIRNYYQGSRTKRFKELARNPKIQQNAIVQAMVENFPSGTHLIGLRTEKGIVVIEGMHRCCALALIGLQGKSFTSKVYLALASYPVEIPEMGRPDSPT